MKLSDYIKEEELHRLELAWRRLTWWQKQQIVIPLKIERLLDQMAAIPYYWLQEYIARRRAQFAYFYPAHWIQTQ
jgi:hypothetical protein